MSVHMQRLFSLAGMVVFLSSGLSFGADPARAKTGQAESKTATVFVDKDKAPAPSSRCSFEFSRKDLRAITSRFQGPMVIITADPEVGALSEAQRSVIAKTIGGAAMGRPLCPCSEPVLGRPLCPCLPASDSVGKLGPDATLILQSNGKSTVYEGPARINIEEAPEQIALQCKRKPAPRRKRSR